MAIRMRAPRPRGRRKVSGPSVREVCLLGMGETRPAPEAGWEAGAEVEWGGRCYRVSALQDPIEPAGTGGRRYVYLSAPVSEAS
jgi:hypothetical protein